MTTYWTCPDLPSTGTESRCCFANITCAEYVCGQFGSNITQSTTNSLVMNNCLVPNGTLATELYMNQSKNNGTCSFNTRGNGCIVRTATNETVTQTPSGTSASSSSPAVSSAASSGNTSDGLNQMGGVNQSLVLGIVGVTWLIKKIYH